MEILLDNSGYELSNLGDVAMLQVAVDRLTGLWPRTRIRVLTNSPERLAKYCPSAIPVVAAALGTLLALGYFPGRYRLPGRFAGRLAAAEARVREYAPELLDAVAVRRARKVDGTRASVEALLDSIRTADLFIVSGGGFFTDAFRRHAHGTLDLLSRASRHGVPAAMLGQGMGPVADPRLLAAMRSVFPHVSLFGLREAAAGPALLRELGVSQSRIAVTGDDAIELAFRVRGAELGRGVGLNLRMARYAEVTGDDIAAVRVAVQHFARERMAPLVPVPIVLSSGISDVTTLRQLLDGWGCEQDGEIFVETPSGVASQISKCRLVVAGSYHAGVFALAQGIPVVGLSKSPYYDAKFVGLAGQFERGCRVVRLDDPHLAETLVTVCRELWDAAPDLRAGLLEAAQQQVQDSKALYSRVRDLVNERCESTP